MRRTVKQFNISNVELFKTQLLKWSEQFQEVAWLDSNQHQDTKSNYEAILAVDAFTSIRTDYFHAFNELKEYQIAMKDWIFGFLTYDLKNAVEDLSSKNFDGLNLPDLYFFQPKKLFLINGTVVEFHYLAMVDDELDLDFQDIESQEISYQQAYQGNPLKIKLRMQKDQYFEHFQKIIDHIHRGDIYEVNFCQEFYAEDSTIDPLKTFVNLNTISKPPFASYFKFDAYHLLCASPERFLQRQGNSVISQPIKGTSKRSKDIAEDAMLIEHLKNDPKELSENVMIVDLVRNDLSKIAVKGSVEVEELCKVYSFLQVHQMISTIVAQVPEQTNSVDLIKSTFPMGSMTGAPKYTAMKIIEEQETFKRGLYSGAVGYITPQGDFDFNVIIRSILYNSEKRYVSFSVGSAITAKSIPENEYEECLVKAKAMRDVLEH
ncbi:anthranilate synthase component I family protein [Galbibacter sp.]|jgi:para-aminobenzoate synthetase component 1|uniref:anthranilate synthase component I family protein n=1 Tax=Galbibacter sp. TaxID=2918471 RepID=UPI003A95467A